MTQHRPVAPEKPAVWAVVLAEHAGSGAVSTGAPTPDRDASLERTLARASSLATSPHHVLVTTTAGQLRSWKVDHGSPFSHRIVQPRHRGSATSLLLALLSVLEQDPGARIVVLPLDRVIEDDGVLQESIRTAFSLSLDPPDDLAVLGAEPTALLSDFGWLLAETGRRSRVRRLSAFLGRADGCARAQYLMEIGCLWNTMILAGRGSTWMALYARRLPQLLLAFTPAFARGPADRLAALDVLYRRLPERDLLADLLHGSAHRLRVVEASPRWRTAGVRDGPPSEHAYAGR